MMGFEEEHTLSYRATNLLRHFSGGFLEGNTGEASGDSDEIELGLSLGGCFSSRGKDADWLFRSSSIPVLLPSQFPPPQPLARACSLPSETEEELRRRKELQSLKRMVAKRKREERRSYKRGIERREDKIEEGSLEKARRGNRVSSPGLPIWIPCSARPTLPLKAFIPASQGSVASQGSSSSAGSELESRPGQGIEIPEFSCGSEVRSPSRVSTVTAPNNHKALSASPSAAVMMASPSNGDAHHKFIEGNTALMRNDDAGKPINGVGELWKNVMEGMPCVSTRGNGPSGRRVDGFLCKYRGGEELRIVCICHGSFLSPAEFVQHAGGGNVAHPLRHILVKPSAANLSSCHQTGLNC